MATQGRMEANAWLKEKARNVAGDVLSIGSGDDRDGEGMLYKEYFVNASSYTTSEPSGCDLQLDVRSMPTVPNSRYDCVFCSAVIEHVDNFHGAISEMTRILKPGGVFLIDFAFNQNVHDAPGDYWRFTPMAIKYLLKDYEILEIKPIDPDRSDFPTAYWVIAKKNA